jgi:Double zinc ribbon
MQNDEREREPGIPQPESGEAADDERSAEEFETVPPGAVNADMGPPQAEWPAAEPIPADADVAPSTPVDAGEETAGPPPSEAEAYAAPTTPAAAESPATAAHSVPATPPIGESTECPRCGTENRPGVAFCRNCGQRLVAAGVATTVERPGAPEGTQQCPRCGTHNRAGVAFCQNCGANLRVTPAPAEGYVPPSLPVQGGTAAEEVRAAPRGGAILGPIVLIVSAIGLVTAWLLPFAYSGGSLWDRSFGAPGGYGIAFWNGYGSVGGGLADKAYFGFAAAAPILIVLVMVLAVAGFLRAAPGQLQRAGIAVALLWALGLAVLFVVIEVVGGWNGDLVSLLREMSPAGIIFLLASLIVLIGGLTRLGRS